MQECRFHLVRFGVLVLVVPLLAVGCGEALVKKATEQAMETAIENSAAENGEKANVDVDFDAGTVKMTTSTDEGEKTMTMEMQGGDGETFSIKASDDSGASAFQMKANEEGMTMTSEDGSVTIAGGEKAQIPADFPKDVPLYEGMELQGVINQAGQKVTSIIGLTSATMGEVAAFYKKDAAENGWAENLTMNQGEQGQILQYSKENRSLQVVLAKEEGKTAISLTYGEH